MRVRGNHIGKLILMVLVMCVAMTIPKTIAFAGGINSNEARVIAAASGTFTYNGKEYKAGSAYLNSLTSYLSGDAIDLTAEQADEAISMMYASVGNGVEQGYLYEVTDDSTTATTAESSTETTETQTTEEEKDGSDNDKSDNDNKDKDSEKKDSTEDSELDVWEAMSNPTDTKKKLEERPEKEEAEVSVQMESDEIVVTTKEQEQITISKDGSIVPEWILNVTAVLAVVMFVITIGCAVILFATKCMCFKKRKGRKARPGHSKRRKIRHNTRAVLTITTAISAIGVLLMVGIYITLFNKNAIMQNMQSSGYFRYAYSEYISSLAEDVQKSAEDGNFDAANVDKIQSYDEYLFTIKQSSLNALDGDMEVVVPDSNVAPYIYNLKVGYMQMFRMAGIFMILNVIIGIVLMIFMDQRRERGVKHTSFSFLIASLVMGAFTLIMAISKPYTQLYIEPDYLYLFLMECIERCITIMTRVTAFGVVIGALLIGVYKTMMNKKE